MSAECNSQNCINTPVPDYLVSEGLNTLVFIIYFNFEPLGSSVLHTYIQNINNMQGKLNVKPVDFRESRALTSGLFGEGLNRQFLLCNPFMLT